ncbi:hypothetical protein [Bosea sp. TAF32]|uniref:hypothetical protein n=1 Tax=Bosea sp. TAF32 TaxID=3237482 RepID=UPI003F900443
MGKVLNFFGAAMMIAGIIILLNAQSAIHEIEAGLCIGLGAVVLSLGIVAGLLQKILDHLRSSQASVSTTAS